MPDLENQFHRVVSSLKKEHIIPDIIPESLDFIPAILLAIEWPKIGKKVDLGDKIPRDWTDDEPEVILSHNQLGDASFTLVITDPDAPSRKDPKNAQFRHWVQTGVKLPGPDDGKYAKKSKPVTTPYYPPAPPEGTSYHRYVFLLFREPSGGVKIPDDAPEANSDDKNRAKWDALKFADTYGLKLAGANYFLTEVPKKS